MSIRTLALGLFLVYAVLLTAGTSRRAVHRHAVFRSGNRRAVSHRSRRSAGGIRRRSSRSRANRSACSARRIDAVADLGIEKKQHPRTAHRAAARPQAQVPHQLSADDLHRRLDRASRVRVQRHPIQRQPAGIHRALVEDVAARLRVRLPLSRPVVRRDRAAGQSHGHPGDPPGRVARNRVRTRAGAHSDDRRHRTGLRGAEHLDHGRARSFFKIPSRASTSATRRTTSTSTSTAR